MSAPDDVRLRLATLVAGHSHPPLEPAAITDDTVLLEGGLDLDSLSLLDLVVSIDEHLGVKTAPADVTPAHFGTFGRLVAYVRSRTGSSAPTGTSPKA